MEGEEDHREGAVLRSVSAPVVAMKKNISGVNPVQERNVPNVAAV